jgi:putative SOS response-associated peptidase YedK
MRRWLAPADPTNLPINRLKSYPADRMTTWKVDSAVGYVKNDEPGLIVAV